MSERPNFKATVRHIRHDLILDAAVSVFSEFGFRGASMKQIAELAGVSEGTIYNAFDDKLDLLVSILDPLEERLSEHASSKGPSTKGPLAARLATFDGRTTAMMRVLLSEALIDDEVRRLFGERIIAPMKPRKGNYNQYAGLCFVLGATMLRLLDQDDPRGERGAVGLLDTVVGAGRSQ